MSDIAQEQKPSPQQEKKPDGAASSAAGDAGGGKQQAEAAPRAQRAQTALALGGPQKSSSPNGASSAAATNGQKGYAKQSTPQATALAISRPNQAPQAAPTAKKNAKSPNAESSPTAKPAVAAALGNSAPPQSPPIDVAKQPSALAQRQTVAPPSFKAPAPPQNAKPLQPRVPTASGPKAAETLAATSAQQEKLSAFFTEARATTAARSAAQQAQVLGTGNAKYQQLKTAIDERARTGAADFAAAKLNITTIVATQQALAHSEAAQAATRLKEDCKKQEKAIDDAVAAEGARMHQDANTQAARINGSVLQTNQAVHAGVNRSLASAERITDADDRAAVKQAVLRESAATREHIGDKGLEDRDTLLGAANEHAQAIKDDACSMFTERDSKMAELLRTVEAGGTDLAQRFTHQATKQLESLSKAEHELARHLAQLETSAAEVLKTSNELAHRIATTAEAQLVALDAAHSKASSSIASASASVTNQIEHAEAPAHQIKAANALAVSEIGKLGTQQVAELRTAHAAQLAIVDGVAGRFGASLDEKVGSLSAKLDGALSKVGAVLSESIATITAQCASERATAQAQYLEAFTQLSATSWAKVQEARSHWHADADKFADHVRTSGDTSISQHAQALAVLPSKLAEVERATLEKQHEGWLSSHIGAIWSGIKTFFTGLIFGIVAIALITILFGGTFAALLVGALAGLYAIYQRIKTLIAQWGDWSLGAKILGVVGSIFAGIGDVVSLTGLLEAAFGNEAVTGRELSSDERIEKTTVSFLTALTLGISKIVSRRVGASGPNETGGNEPSNAEAANREPKDLATRTTNEERAANKQTAADEPLHQPTRRNEPAPEKPPIQETQKAEPATDTAPGTAAETEVPKAEPTKQGHESAKQSHDEPAPAKQPQLGETAKSTAPSAEPTTETKSGNETKSDAGHDANRNSGQQADDASSSKEHASNSSKEPQNAGAESSTTTEEPKPVDATTPSPEKTADASGNNKPFEQGKATEQAKESGEAQGGEAEVDPDQERGPRIPHEEAANWDTVRPKIGKRLTRTTEKGWERAGYRTFERGGKRFLKRINANPKEFAQLAVDENGFVQKGPLKGSNRLSIPGKLAANLGPKPAGLKMQAHHLIPDEIVRSGELFKFEREVAKSLEAAKKPVERYDLDRASNGLYLPEDDVAQQGSSTPQHRGSHPNYSTIVRNAEASEWSLIEAARASGRPVTHEMVLRAIDRLEGRMRQVVNNWNVNTNGKLKLD